MTSRAEVGGGGSQYHARCVMYGGGGKRLCDVTHITSVARPGQGVVDDSASIQEIISTYQNFDTYTMLTVANVLNHTKICIVFETLIDL